MNRFEKVNVPRIGQSCHVDGWHIGCWFILEKIENDIAYLVTPKTRKRFQCHVNQLLETRKNQS